MTAKPREEGQVNSGRQLKDEVSISTGQSSPPGLLIEEIGWSRDEALETRARLAAFEEDWEAPGMKAYDNL